LVSLTSQESRCIDLTSISSQVLDLRVAWGTQWECELAFVPFRGGYRVPGTRAIVGSRIGRWHLIWIRTGTTYVVENHVVITHDSLVRDMSLPKQSRDPHFFLAVFSRLCRTNERGSARTSGVAREGGSLRSQTPQTSNRWRRYPAAFAASPGSMFASSTRPTPSSVRAAQAPRDRSALPPAVCTR
jgi:hypothetical protein